MSKYQLTVDPQPAYLPGQSAPGQQVYTFAYTITILNVGEVAAQLIARHWDIEDADGQTQTVDGLGVVGHQPLLQPGESFRYTSSARLRTPMGIMSGHYFFVAVDGTRFEVAIAPFVLRAEGVSGGSTLH
ncbi:Co2+/Mg2+ efflux protein ApaG [Hydrogenophaga aquatica]